jgi:hypothetical protein
MYSAIKIAGSILLELWSGNCPTMKQKALYLNTGRMVTRFYIIFGTDQMNKK